MACNASARQSVREKYLGDSKNQSHLYSLRNSSWISSKKIPLDVELNHFCHFTKINHITKSNQITKINQVTYHTSYKSAKLQLKHIETDVGAHRLDLAQQSTRPTRLVRLGGPAEDRVQRRYTDVGGTVMNPYLDESEIVRLRLFGPEVWSKRIVLDSCRENIGIPCAWTNFLFHHVLFNSPLHYLKRKAHSLLRGRPYPFTFVYRFWPLPLRWHTMT